MATYKIYKIENTVNSLLYVGCTTVSLEARMAMHRNVGRPPHSRAYKDNPLYMAMGEIGVDKFSISLLEEGPFEEQHRRWAFVYGREREWIEILNTIYPHGYNRSVFKLTDADVAIIRFNAYGLKVAEYATLFGYSQISIRSIQSNKIGRMYPHVTREHLPADIEDYALQKGHKALQREPIF